MTTFTIDNESNRIIPGELEHDGEVPTGTERFSSHADLADLAADWPMTRLIEIWNNLPGVKPVNKFKDRKTAITRIWIALHAAEISTPLPTEYKAEERLAAETPQESEVAAEPEQQPTFAPEPAQEPDVAPPPTVSPKKATRKKKVPTAPTTAKGSKTAAVLELLQRDGGVTAKELMAVTGWRAHSVRGFISGTLGKKMGLTVLSNKNENGERTYRIQ